MNTILVETGKPYSVLVGYGLFTQLGSLVTATVKARKAAVISDSNVFPLYGRAVTQQLLDAGLETVSFVFEAGEEQKNAQTYLKILDFLAENKITRSDCLIALGGGVVGDMTGFAAATFLRGIDYIQIPTTLLAAVDSSVGGKTAIDLAVGKNLVGAFHQPRLVICDLDTLRTLPEDVFRDGCAEVIKYGVLYDASLFHTLLDKGMDFDREAVVTRCVELKRDVVAQDEFDKGARQQLNLGHTFGHGIEAQSRFQLSHGKGVAIGMAMIARSGTAMGITEQGTGAAIEALLHRFRLPTTTEFSPEDIFESALSDKKRTGGTVNLIVPRRIGSCVVRPTAVDELKSWIEAGM